MAGDVRPGLFQAFGVELEYMIVDLDTLAVKPLAGELFVAVSGGYGPEIQRGRLAWSNEVVSHVVELKTDGPAPALEGLAGAFHREVLEIRGLLAPMGATLLGTGAHPFMDPETETRLWPHEYSRVYRLYDRVFGCRGHGWSNLQASHLNLPFRDDREFGQLHAAVRLVLPLIPGLAAGSPVLDGRPTGLRDSRLEAYRKNQARLPALTGPVVPEPVFSRDAYDGEIFGPIRRAMAPHDPQGITDPEWLNSRGAIARFSRGSLEIRLPDAQECPRADLAVLEAIAAVLRGLVEERWSSSDEQRSGDQDTLVELLLAGIREGEGARLPGRDFAGLFGAGPSVVTVGDLWADLAGRIGEDLSDDARESLARLLDQGTLATRILRALGPEPPTRETLGQVYRELETCMAENRLLTGRPGTAPGGAGSGPAPVPTPP